MRKMATASLHSDVFLDSEDGHGRASRCAYAYDGSLVRSSTDGNNNNVLSAMQRTGVTEQLNALCGRLCWRWKDSITMQQTEIKERQHWFFTWRKLSSGSVFLWCGLGRRTSTFPGRSCVCHAGTSSTSGEYSSEDAWRGRYYVAGCAE